MQKPETVRQQDRVKDAEERVIAVTEARRKHQRGCPSCPTSLNHLQLFCDDGYSLLTLEQSAKTALRAARQAATISRSHQTELPI